MKILDMLHKMRALAHMAYGVLKKYRTLIACAIAVVLFIVSFLAPVERYSIEKESSKIEKKIRQRQQILEKYVQMAFEVPVEERLDIEGFPEDMVIYKYNADTIQSWINQFPINNDEVDVIPLWYRLHYMNSRSLFNTPLA